MKTKKTELIREEEDNNGLFLGLVLITAAISAGIAILYAPKSGKETREQIKDLAGKQKDNLTEQINRGKEKATEVVDNVKNKYDEVAVKATEVVDNVKNKYGEVAYKATEVVDNVKNKYSEVAEQAKSKLENLTHKGGTTASTDLGQNDY